MSPGACGLAVGSLYVYAQEGGGGGGSGSVVARGCGAANNSEGRREVWDEALLGAWCRRGAAAGGVAQPSGGQRSHIVSVYGEGPVKLVGVVIVREFGPSA